MKNIGIVGARKYRDRQSVIDLVNSLSRDTTVVTSSCRGVCTWAVHAAKATKGAKGIRAAIHHARISTVFERKSSFASKRT